MVIAILITIILKIIGTDNSTIISSVIVGSIIGPLSLTFFGKDK